jgi:hypothetical protein
MFALSSPVEAKAGSRAETYAEIAVAKAGINDTSIGLLQVLLGY